MKGTVNDGIRKYHEVCRLETYGKIEDAIINIRDERNELSIKNIAKYSKLVPSIFCKPHVKEFLLKTYGIGAKSPIVIARHGDTVPAEDYNKLLKHCETLQKDRLSAENSAKRQKEARLKAEQTLAERDQETKVLRGQLDIAMRKGRLASAKDKFDRGPKLVHPYDSSDEQEEP
jgi:hypothetical protein